MKKSANQVPCYCPITMMTLSCLAADRGGEALSTGGASCDTPPTATTTPLDTTTALSSLRHSVASGRPQGGAAQP
jgi:hypothetical protein